VHLVQAIQRPANGPHEPTNRRARSSAFTAARDRTPSGPDGRASNASDSGVLHHSDGLVSLTRRGGGVLVAVWDGTVDAGRGLVAGATGVPGGFPGAVVLAICWTGLVPVQFAMTIPVTTAVTITRAIPIAISFQGLFQLLSISTLLGEN
jgi:hypothetical protein